MRRAMSPVICTKRTSPRGVRTVTEAWALSVEAAWFQAARNLPGAALDVDDLAGDRACG